MRGEREKLAVMGDEELHHLYSRVFDTVEGRLVLEHLKLACFYYVPSFDEHTGNQPFSAIFNEGKRSIVLHIETQLLPIKR